MCDLFYKKEEVKNIRKNIIQLIGEFFFTQP
jgi:hypothetical protein